MTIYLLHMKREMKDAIDSIFLLTKINNLKKIIHLICYLVFM